MAAEVTFGGIDTGGTGEPGGVEAGGIRPVRQPRKGHRAEKRLTDLEVRSFISRGAPGRKLADGGGLFLVITSGGSASWRVKYRFGGKEKLYTIGVYPRYTLEDARAELDWVKKQLDAAKDPMLTRRLEAAAEVSAAENPFEAVAEAWLKRQRTRWSAVHYDKSRRALERDVYPHLGKLPIRDISPAMVAAVIERIADRGVTDTAGKVFQHTNAVFRYAQARGLRSDNPADPVREILPKRGVAGRQPALLDFAALGDVLRRAEIARLSPAVRLAHRLCAHSVARIGNVVSADWKEFDLNADQPVWIIPRKKMKSRDRHHDHKVLLSPTIASELQAWKHATGGKGNVFPSPTGRGHITREALEKVYRVTLGLADKHTPHGWRAAFSTLARENGFTRDAVELALDHVHDTEVVRAYDRGERLAERARLMDWWGDQLQRAQRGADVVPIRAIPQRRDRSHK